MSLIWIVNILSVFFLCVFFAGIVIPQILLIAFRRRLFDEPDERKIHQCVVPRLGGMAFKPVVFFSFVLLLAVNVSTGHDELLKEIGAEALPLAYAFCAIIMLYLVGIADDLIGVRYRAKFFIQIVCGIMLVAGGVELSDLHGMLFIHSMPSWISIPLTVFVTVFIINAINLIDGIDGLASGLCSIAFLFYGMTLSGSTSISMPCLPSLLWAYSYHFIITRKYISKPNELSFEISSRRMPKDCWSIFLILV